MTLGEVNTKVDREWDPGKCLKPISSYKETNVLREINSE